MVAEEIRKDPIYISFRGSHTAQDWKDNLKSFQTKHLDAVQGIFVYFLIVFVEEGFALHT